MGRVEIYKSDADGRKLTLWFIEPKETFCLASLHIPKDFANALVVEDAMLYTLKENDFEDFVAQSGEISARFVHCMSKKMALYSTMVDGMAFKGIMSRLVKVLLEYQKKDTSKKKS
jgi:CRP-like cAMP-binding protein